MFKVGDRVVYIGDSDAIEFNKIYTISKMCNLYKNEYMTLIEMKNDNKLCSTIRFINLKEYRKQKLKKINENV
jgi:hypothetical protein